jgi:alpha-glucosidase
MGRRRPWWRDAVFYQVYPRSFADSDGDGIGDLPGIIDRLDYLNGTPDSLGVDAIWLSPFYPSPMADFGYDISDYCGVDPLFGTLRDFDRLVHAAHVRGIRVVIDLVPNHTSDQHPWFVDARAGGTHRDWYVWRPGRDGGPPNNWQSEFGAVGPAWTLDPQTGVWYLHSFLPQQPDLNWDVPEVERQMHDVMRFWLERGVDGFRIDVVYKIAKDPLLRDNPTRLVGPGGTPGERRDEDWPSVHPRLRRLRSVIKSFGERMTVGEVYLLDPTRLAAYVRTGTELDLAHNFQFLTLPWDASAFRDSVEGFSALVAPRGWPTWCLNNHDHSRVATRYPGERAARVAALMLLTLRGTVFLYQGEELGLRDGIVSPKRIVDVDGRDPERCPLPWEPPSIAGPGAGFTSGDPWLPLPPEPERLNVARQRADPGSIFSLYRRLLEIRRRTPALRAGALAFVDQADRDVLVYLRHGRARTFLVALNFADRSTVVAIPDVLRAKRGRVLLSTDDFEATPWAPLDTISLAPLSGVLVELAGYRDARPSVVASG